MADTYGCSTQNDSASLTQHHTIGSYGLDRYTVDGVQLPYGAYVSESRKRLICNGGCGRVFENNLQRFIRFRTRRFCFHCAASGKVK